MVGTSSEVDNQSTKNEASNKGDYAKRSTPPADKVEKSYA